MRYPTGNGQKLPAVVTREFKGLNHLARGAEGEFSDCRNVSSNEYPCVTTSKGYEGVETDCGRVMAIYSVKDGFCGVAESVDGPHFYYKGTKYEYSTGGKRIDASSEVYICAQNGVFFICEKTQAGDSVLYKASPDAPEESDRVLKQCNIENAEFKAMLNCEPTAYGQGSDEYIRIDGAVLIAMNTENELTLGNYNFAEDVQTNLANATYYILQGPKGEEDKFMLYREKESDFNNWCSENGQNRERVPAYVTGLKNSMMVYNEFTVPFPDGEQTFSVGKSYAEKLIVASFVNRDKTGFRDGFLSTGKDVWHEIGVIAKNYMPPVTPMESYKGRLWCARIDGTSILASSSENGGDDFFYFSGTAAASVYINSQLPGAFVGVKAYNDSLIAFKEDSMTVIYGDTAANFAIGKEIPGVGCIDIRSAQSVDGVLYFCSPSGFYAYAGGRPQMISKKLKVRYTSCKAFVSERKYYAEGTKKNGEKEILVYDTESGIWLAEEAKGVVSFCTDKNEVYIAAGGEVLRKKKADEEPERLEWYFESMEICEGVFEKKSISEIYIKAKLAKTSEMTVSVITDSEEEKSKTFYGNGKVKGYRVPIRLKKDDSYKIRVSGCGEALIYEMERKVTAGGRNISD